MSTTRKQGRDRKRWRQRLASTHGLPYGQEAQRVLEDGVRQRADPVPAAAGPCQRRAPGGLAPARHSVEQVVGTAAGLPNRRRTRGDSPSRPRSPATRETSRRASGKERRAGRRREADARHAGWRPAHSDSGGGSAGGQRRPTAAEETSQLGEARRRGCRGAAER